MNNRSNQTTADAIDLRHYIKRINADAAGGFLLTDDLDHWAKYGIYTKEQLGRYLDGCVEREQAQSLATDDDYDRTMPECDDDPYYRECRSATSGDDMSKADYMDMYSRMDREDW